MHQDRLRSICSRRAQLPVILQFRRKDMKFTRMVLPIAVAGGMLAQNPSSQLKQLEDDAIGNAILSALNACQPLAPSPFGSFVPPSTTLNVTAQTVLTPAITLPGPFPITIPARTLAVTSGAVTLPGSLFLPPAPRVCTVSAAGDSVGHPPHPPGKSSFALKLLIDYSTYLGNASGGGCAQASGNVAFTKQDNGSSVE